MNDEQHREQAVTFLLWGVVVVGFAGGLFLLWRAVEDA